MSFIVGSYGQPAYCGKVPHYFYAVAGGYLNFTYDYANNASIIARADIDRKTLGSLSGLVNVSLTQTHWLLVGWYAPTLAGRPYRWMAVSPKGAYGQLQTTGGPMNPQTIIQMTGTSTFYENNVRALQSGSGWIKRYYSQYMIGLQVAYDPSKNWLGVAYTAPPPYIPGV